MNRSTSDTSRDGCEGIEDRFEKVRRAYEQSRLIIEIFYELIKAGKDLRLPEDVLRESGLIMLHELQADLVVCRLRNERGAWENVYAGSETRTSTPIFVRFMEETDPRHPVMRALGRREASFVISNDLRRMERGGESLSGEPRREGYRSRLTFILRDDAGRPFGLLMLYSPIEAYFDRFDPHFLQDCGNIVSLTVGRRLAVGRDALAKAAGGVAHVGNNVLGIMRNVSDLILEDLEDLLDRQEKITVEIAGRALRLVEPPPAPGTVSALVEAARSALSAMGLEEKLQQVNLLRESITRLARAIENLGAAVRRPVLMRYLGEEEVLDLEAGGREAEMPPRQTRT